MGTLAAEPAIMHLVRVLQLPVDVASRSRAQMHLLDWLACTAGAGNDPSLAALDSLAEGDAVSQAAIWSRGYGSTQSALLCNGMLGNLLEMDDVHRRAILHPGPVVIPALLATCTVHTSGNALLDGIVRGYEAMIRLGIAVGSSHYRYWHPTSTCGALGAAAGCASMLKLDALPSAWALGNAVSRTGGLWQMRHEAVPTKSLHNAEAARSGWLAAQLAARDFAGPISALDGEQGLFAATSSDADPAALAAELQQWSIHQVSFKPWPACRHAHPAIDALQKLPIEALTGDVRRIRVRSYREAIAFCDRVDPQTPLQARFSIQHALAAICVHGRPQLQHYQGAALVDPDLAALRRRVELIEDRDLSLAFPAHYGAAVELEAGDGRVFSSAVADAWGDPEWPMDQSALQAKASMLMDWGGVSVSRQQRLFAAVAALNDEASVAGLLDAVAERD